MTKFVYTLFAVAFLFSCRKERLKDEKEVFIGEWELVYSVNQSYSLTPSSSYCRLDTIISDPSSKTYLTFKKKGKVILKIKDKKKRFSMNFKDEKLDGLIRFIEKSEFKLLCSDSINSNIGSGHYFSANFHSATQFFSGYYILGYVNDNWLILNTSDEIISEVNYSDHKDYYNYFKKVN